MILVNKVLPSATSACFKVPFCIQITNSYRSALTLSLYGFQITGIIISITLVRYFWRKTFLKGKKNHLHLASHLGQVASLQCMTSIRQEIHFNPEKKISSNMVTAEHHTLMIQRELEWVQRRAMKMVRMTY